MGKNLDPLQPFTWYQLGSTSKELDFPKVCLFFPYIFIYCIQQVRNVFYKFNHSLMQAAVNLFPEIGLEETKFLRVPSMLMLLNNQKF